MEVACSPPLPRAGEGPGVRAGAGAAPPPKALPRKRERGIFSFRGSIR